MHTLKALLRRVDFYLRNKPYCPPSDDSKLVSFEDVFEKDPEDDPLRTKMYWAVYRFWANHWLCNPRSVYREIKWFVQRGRRGWADCDTWSLDNYLSRWLPDALRHLKTTRHGIPCEMFDGLPTNAEGYHDDAEFAIAAARWDAIMNKMVAGFEAWNRIQDGLYEGELGEYPMRRPDGVSREDWKKTKDDRFKASRLLEERDKEIFDEGMKLFSAHFGSLWD